MDTNRNSLTQGSIFKGLLLFALPVLLGNIFQQLYNTVDSLIVGWFLGDKALAAVSSSGNLIFLFVGLFNGMAIGAGVVIARAFGAKDYDTMEKVIHTDVAFGLAMGIFVTVCGIAFTPTILHWMGTPADVLPQSISYFRWYFTGALFTVMYNIFVGILHAMGDSKHPLYYLIFSSIVNVILDILLVGVFHMGVGAAALATTISQGISAALCCVRLLKLEGPGKLIPKRIRFHAQSLSSIIRFGLPSGVQNCVISLANVVLQSHINVFGATAMAGCGAYFKLEGFAFLPVTCFVQALSTFVGQNLGAKQYERTKKGALYGTLCSVGLSEAVGICFYIFCPYLIRLFGCTEESVVAGVTHCRTVCLAYFLVAFSHCAAGILRGAGKAIIPMLTTLMCWCVIRVIYISVAVRFIPKLTTVLSGYPVTWVLSSIAFLIYILKADWLHHFDRLETEHPKGAIS